MCMVGFALQIGGVPRGQKILFQHELDLLLTQNKSEMLQEWAADFLISPQTAAS